MNRWFTVGRKLFLKDGENNIDKMTCNSEEEAQEYASRKNHEDRKFRAQVGGYNRRLEADKDRRRKKNK